MLKRVSTHFGPTRVPTPPTTEGDGEVSLRCGARAFVPPTTTTDLPKGTAQPTREGPRHPPTDGEGLYTKQRWDPKQRPHSLATSE